MEDLVVQLSKTQTEYIYSDAVVNLIYSSKGEGKCLSPHTEVMMYDGSLKAAKDIVVDDLVMGDDSTPRRVLSLIRGRGPMYEVVLDDGESFVCNGDHILVTKVPELVPSKLHTVVFREREVSVDDALHEGLSYSQNRILYRSAVDFEEKPVSEHPYVFGVSVGKAIVSGRDASIPMEYRCNSVRVRSAVLAGIKSEAGVSRGYYSSFRFKRQSTPDDFVFLCRSLGLGVFKKDGADEVEIGVSGGHGSDLPGWYGSSERFGENGLVHQFVSITEIKPIGDGDYCGFMLDGNHRFLLGNFVVSHNSFASIIAMIYHGKRCGTPVRWAVVRDSHENIKISTVRSIMDALPAGYYKFKNDFKYLEIFSDPPVYADLFGIDDLSAVSKLQGPEYAGIWLEEPAPIADAMNAGLSEDVYNAALASCARQRGTVPRLQISMNPGNEDHWTFRRFFQDPVLSSDGVHLFDPNNPMITIRIFRAEVGENKFLPEIARQAARAAYANDPQSYARYAKGEFAKVYVGKRVTPDYNANGQHYSDFEIEPAPGLVGFIGLDAWHSPAAVIGQQTRTGRLIFIDTVRVLESDIRTLIKSQVLPLINSPRWKDKCRQWRVIGDCSMRQPDQSNKMQSAARVAEELIGVPFEPGPKLWDHLRSAVTKALNENIKGQPAIIVNKSNRLLHDALSGSWHYKTDKGGNIVNTIPFKNEASHVGDAFANVCAVMMPDIGGNMFDRKKWSELSRRVQNRAISY